MKTLMLTSTRSYISKTYSMELLNLFCGFVCSLYFITRSVTFAENKVMLWTGIFASGVWVYQTCYSYLGYRKMSSIKTGEDPIAVSIQKIANMIEHYKIQKSIYLWMAPLTIGVSIPIPCYEFLKRDISYASPEIILYSAIVFVISTGAAIFLSKKFWEIKLQEPLENAKQNLQEILE